MTIDLRGKPIAITGASSGIGAAAALACARAGMPVVLAARREDRLAALVEQIRRDGSTAEAVRCDVRNPDDCRRVIDRTVEAFGSIYAVFANAGYGIERATLDMTDAEWRDIVETNFFGSLHVIRPAAEHMKRAGAGHIVMCSSCLSKIGIPYYAAYCFTKAGQDYSGRAMRFELREFGIHVSTLHPTTTRTELWDVMRDRNGGAMKVKPMARETRMHTPEKVAAALVRCLRKPRGEVWMSKSLRLGLGLGVMFPALADFGLRRMAAKRLK